MSYSSEPHIVGTPNEYPLASPPSDGISSLAFSPNSASRDLLTSSWDGQVRLYDVGTSASHNSLRASYGHQSPVLSAAFIDGTRCASGALDGSLKLYDFQVGTEQACNGHDKAIRHVAFASSLGILLSGSWDQSVGLWDPRSAGPIQNLPQAERVYALAVSGNRAIVGTAGRKVWVWDLRQTGAPEQRRESSLKFQTRAIAAFPDGQGFVLSSIEGRVAVEWIAEADQRRKYAFKCHRAKEEGVELVYPVNALAFHPTFGTFATGGSDSFVNVWDPVNKKRLCQFHRYPTSIASLAFSTDGSLLAIATSYQYEQKTHPDPLPKDAIFIRKLSDQETRPKS